MRAGEALPGAGRRLRGEARVRVEPLSVGGEPETGRSERSFTLSQRHRSRHDFRASQLPSPAGRAPAPPSPPPPSPPPLLPTTSGFNREPQASVSASPPPARPSCSGLVLTGDGRRARRGGTSAHTPSPTAVRPSADSQSPSSYGPRTHPGLKPWRTGGDRSFHPLPLPARSTPSQREACWAPEAAAQ